MSLYLLRLIRIRPSSGGFSIAYNRRSLSIFYCYKGKETCNLLSVAPELYLKKCQRNYSLKLYSSYDFSESNISNTVLEYIKSQNNIGLHCDDNFVDTDSQITNVFDSESAIKQLQSIILHSLESHPEEVIKLFSLYNYKSYTRSKLYHTYGRKESSKLMQMKIQTAILSMSFDQLNHFSTALKNVLVYKIEFFSHLTAFVFEECFTRAENSQSLDEIFQYFLIGFHLFGNGVWRQHEYSDFVSLILKHIEEASPSQLAQFVYFCGLAKKNSLFDLSTLETISFLSKFDELSFIDSGLAINGLFKLNLKLDNDIGSLIKKKIMQKINQESSIVVDNVSSFAFVSLIKYLRMIVYKDEELMSVIKLFIEQIDEDICSPQFAAHFIALFANSNYYDPDGYSKLSDIFFKHLRSSTKVVRIKDISRVMWSLSHARHPCKPEDLEFIEEELYKFCKSGDFSIHAMHVVDSVLSLAMLDVNSEKLMKSVLQPHFIQKFKDKNQSRPIARLMVLNQVQKATTPSLNISLPEVPGNFIPTRSVSKEFETRPCLDRAKKAADWLRDECRTKVFEFRFNIPYINYCSMVFCNSCVKGFPVNATDIGSRVIGNLAPFRDSKIVIDIDDEITSFNNGERTNGLEELKRKLMRINGFDVKVLSSKDIELCGDDDQAVAALILKKMQE